MDLQQINSVLAQAQTAVGRGAMTHEEIEELRGALRALSDGLGETPMETAAKVWAQMLNRRLGQLSKARFRSEDGAITPQSITALPIPNQKKFGRPLKKQEARAEEALRTLPRETVAYQSATFRCKADYDACRSASSGADKMWCHLAMVLCLVSGVATVKLSLSPQG